MSTLQKVKAYFGMVPLDQYDDYELHGQDHFDQSEYTGRVSRTQRSHEIHDNQRDYGQDNYDHYQADSYGESNPRSGRLEPLSHSARIRGIAYPSVSAHRTSGQSGYDTHLTQGDLALDSRHYADEHPVTGQIATLKPKDYSEARIVGERFREGSPVIMDLVNMENADAKRLVDFAAGLAFALRGTFDKVATKVFLLSPAGIEVSAEDRRRIAETGFYSRDF